MTSIQKLNAYGDALKKYQAELVYRSKLDEKELMKREAKKPLGREPSPDMFQMDNEDFFAKKVREQIMKPIIKPTIKLPVRRISV